MTIRGEAHHGDWAETFWMIIGWAAILLPALYMTSIAAGEHANVQVGFGLLASALHGAVWAAIWFDRGRMGAPKRRMMFAVGATLCLVGFVSVGAATENLGWAGLAYLLIAALVVWVTKRPATNRSTAEQS